jgi:nitroreductase
MSLNAVKAETRAPEIIKFICNRRSIRHFTPEPLENETLILLLKAAMSAPTACNSQTWEFIVVTEQEILDEIRSRFLFARYNAPAAIVVCGCG